MFIVSDGTWRVCGFLADREAVAAIQQLIRGARNLFGRSVPWIGDRRRLCKASHGMVMTTGVVAGYSNTTGVHVGLVELEACAHAFPRSPTNIRLTTTGGEPRRLRRRTIC